MASQPEPKFQAPIIVDDNAEQPADPLYVPEGYESVDEFLEYARTAYKEDAEYDKDNRDMALDDLKFIAGDQWDPQVLAAREGRPCPVINTLPQFVGQVIGDRRMNKTAIKLIPTRDATAAEAQKRAAIIKGIEYRSRADRVYDNGLENQVSCGIGNWRINMDYADDDVFEQDIFIKQIANPLAVVWDFLSVDSTGRDAIRCFVQDNIPDKAFERAWPDAQPDQAMVEELGLHGAGWFAKNVVRVCEFWEMLSRPKTIALNALGQIIDVTGQDIDQLIAENKIYIDPRTQKPKIREGRCSYARMHLITGTHILAGPYELPINRLPIIRVEGRIVNVGDDRFRYSLIRWAKDPSRMRNYWRGVAIEKLAMAPKAKWVGEDAAFAGYEEDWRNAHISTDPLLKYKQGAKEPQQVAPPPIDAAILQEAAMNTDDIKQTTGLYDASLGIRSNEVSGRAINARKVEGDVATVVFHDNHNAAIQETGDVVNQLLDICYDTTRQLLAIGEDDKESVVEVNNPSNPDAIDLSKGKYTAAVTTGPSFTTQRQEGAQALLEMIKVAPDIMGLAADIIVKYQDFPGAMEIAERLKAGMIAKGIIQSEEDGEPQQLTPQIAEQIKQAAIQEFVQSLEGKAAEVELRLKEAQAKEAEANAEKAEHEAEKAEIEVEALSVEKAAFVLRGGQEPERPPSGNSQPRSGAPRRAARSQKPKKGNAQ